MKKVYFIIVFLIVILSKAQRYNNWHFGYGAGLNFSTTVPTALSNGLANHPDCASSISDLNGNLLFYTDGVSVWNKNHIVMPNGSGLIGHYSAGQCAVIVPVPCNANKYVIFHVTEFSSPGYLHYSVVDMNLASGLGDLVSTQKNVSLGTGWTEKICAYYNAAGNNYWVLVHQWGNNNFVAFNVNATSIATQSVVSSIGTSHTCGSYGGAHDAMGQLTISPDGAKVINALTCQDKFELFDFNSNTGVLSNSISLTGNGGSAWGTAFSPDSKKIFTNSIFGQSIYQYDINTFNLSSIVSSQVNLYTSGIGGYNFGYMELGPDNKVYIAKPNAGYISVINNPNTLGSGSNFQLVGPGLGSNTSSWGLPRIAYKIPVSGGANVLISSNSPSNSICLGQSLTLNASGAASYTWSNNSTSPSITISPNVTTTYSIVASGGCSGASNSSITITVIPAPVLSITGNTAICVGQTAILTASGATNYNWSTGGTQATVGLSPSVNTTYTVSGSNAVNACIATKTVGVKINPNPSITIAGNNSVCVGQTASLVASGANTYLWSLNLQGGFLNVTPTITTTYSVVGTATNSCQSSTNITVVVSPSLTILVGGNTSLCYGNTTTLTASGASSYTWNSLSTGSVYTVAPTTTSIYTVTGTDNQSKCLGKTTVTVTLKECVGINEVEKQWNNWTIYPNPFSDKFALEFKGLSQNTVTVYLFNATGQLILEKEQLLADSKVEIDAKELPKGIYFVKLIDGKNQTTLKVIKHTH
jgi:hypothetical protein